MRKPCLGCGNLFELQAQSLRQANQGLRCPTCRSTFNRGQNRARHAKPSQRTYSDAAYRAIPKPYGMRCALQIENVCTGLAETWDAVVPAAKGGKHELGNLQPACRACNSSKHDRVI
ncbi:HNH endonuclease [Mycolicibacterium farcinogenes]|nr:HNH endonuclease [Mycolicibacterium farcinogenes]